MRMTFLALSLAIMTGGPPVDVRAAEDPTPVARLHGENLRSDDPEEVRALIASRLLADYAERNGITVTDEEVAAYVANMERRLEADLGDDYTSPEDLPPAEAAEARAMRSEMGRSLIRHWKINRALYAEYGGRVIGQQLGPEPLDAYRALFEQRQKAGDFAFLDAATEAAFWGYFTDERRHSFLDPAKAEEVFQRKPWEAAPDR